MKKLLHFLAITQLLFILKADIIRSTSQNQRRVLSKELIYNSSGTSTFLIDYLSSDSGSDWKTNNKYCPLFRNTIEDQNLKELELLLAYVQTFAKDINNKCKISLIRNYGKQNIGYPQLKKRCALWQQFILKIAPTTIHLMEPHFAFNSFQVVLKQDWSMEKEENNLEKFFDNVDNFEGLNDIFFQAIQQDINESNSSKESLQSRRIDYSVINEYYGPQFKEIFDTVMPNGKIERYQIEMSYLESKAVDELYGISQDVSQIEYSRIRENQSAEPEGGFDDTDQNSMYRYYNIGWLEPLDNFNNYLKYIRKN